MTQRPPCTDSGGEDVTQHTPATLRWVMLFLLILGTLLLGGCEASRGSSLASDDGALDVSDGDPIPADVPHNDHVEAPEVEHDTSEIHDVRQDVRHDEDSAESDGDAEEGDADRSDAAPPEDARGDGSTDDVAPPPPTRCPPGPAPSWLGEEIGLFTGFQAATFVSCARMIHPLVAARGQRWQVDVEGVPPDTRLFVFDARYLTRGPGDLVPPALAQSSFARESDGRLRITFEAARSGEHALVLERDSLLRAPGYNIRATCLSACDREATRFPVVLLHGYAGVDSYFGVVDYFWGIRDLLRDKGYVVATPVSNPVATSEDRAVDLRPQLLELLRETGARKLHLFGHSQGGMDARILAHDPALAGRIASVTTLATPHLGIGVRIADFLSVQNFNVEFMEQTFNPRYTDMEGVHYASWSARACQLTQRTCLDETGGALVNAILATSHAVIGAERGPNDGVVPTAAMTWGKHLGEVPADHFGQVGHLFRGPNAGGPFDHRAFYLGEMRRLRELERLYPPGALSP